VSLPRTPGRLLRRSGCPFTHLTLGYESEPRRPTAPQPGPIRRPRASPGAVRRGGNVREGARRPRTQGAGASGAAQGPYRRRSQLYELSSRRWVIRAESTSAGASGPSRGGRLSPRQGRVLQTDVAKDAAGGATLEPVHPTSDVTADHDPSKAATEHPLSGYRREVGPLGDRPASSPVGRSRSVDPVVSISQDDYP
jgi:hypothetical protein